MMGGARGVIIPHQFVKAIGAIFIINKASLPMASKDDSMDMSSGAAMEAGELV